MGSTSNRWVQTVHYCAAGEGYLVVGDGFNFTLMAEHSPALVPVAEEVPETPGIFLRAVPNPFNPRVTLEFNMPAAGLAEVEVYDLRGRRVIRLDREFEGGGPALVSWDGRDSGGRSLPSGVYLARVSTAEGQAVRKVVLTR